MFDLNLYFRLTNEFFKEKKIEDIKDKSQYFTPVEEAEKLLDDLDIIRSETVRILDPCCGNGILLFKLLDKILADYSPKQVLIDVYDIDMVLLNNVEKIMETVNFREVKLKINYINSDFLKSDNKKYKYHYIVMNPPYKKINVEMVPENLATNLYGQPNLYHLFITKTLDMLVPNGVLCIISPKNYLSGKYTEKLRQYITEHFSIIKIHTFNDRRTIFGNSITQEICIIHIKKSSEYDVTISYNGNAKLKVRVDEILANDNTKIIYTPRNIEDVELKKKFEKFPVGTIGKDILMKTGKIVQFRVVGKDVNLKEEEFFHFDNGVPLIVYRHINTSKLKYQPLIGKNKNKAITLIDDSRNRATLIKNSNYVLIRKNTDKKYDKLIHAIAYFKDLSCNYIALDNGIAYFTNSNDSLTKEEVLGLQCILMSKQFDDYYRMINSSHTINVYELENMHFPSIETIRLIGSNMLSTSSMEQASEIFQQFL